MRGLQGRTAIVTGAAAGIGLATVGRLLEEGVRVAAVDVDERALAELAVDTWVADLRDPAAIAATVAAIADRFGGIDILVNNAGVAVPGSVESLDLAGWDRLMEVNLRGAWLMLKHSVPFLRRAGNGAVVNVSSLQGLLGFSGWSGYATTKAALIGMTRQAAVEYAADGIRVNAVAPATIATPMNLAILREAADPRQVEATWNSLHPLGRVGEPAEVAAGIAFLASAEASFITGHVLNIDGGAGILGSAQESS